MRRRTLVMAVGGLSLVAVYVMFLAPPNVPHETVTAVRDPSGRTGYRQEGHVENGGFGFRFTRLDASHQVSSTSSTGTSQHDRVFARTVAIYNLDDSLLMQRVGVALFAALRDAGRFESVTYLPFGESLPAGETLPDLFVTLDLGAWEENGLPGFRRFDGDIVATFGDRLRRSRFHLFEDLDPPRAEFSWVSAVRYNASQVGIESSAVRYAAVGQEIAEQIAAKMEKVLSDLETRQGEAPQLPESFYPSYVAPPAIALLDGLAAEKLVDGSSLMAPTIAVWRTEPVSTPSEALAAAADALQRDGWSVREKLELGVVYASRAEQILEVFVEEAPEHEPQRGQLVSIRQPSRAGGQPARLFIIFVRKMPADAIRTSLAEWLATDASAEALAMFPNL